MTGRITSPVEMDGPAVFDKTNSPVADLPPIDALESLALEAESEISRELVGFATNDIRSRPFSLLRGQFMKEASRAGRRLIGVTSAAPGAGKTFVTSNLAASISKIPGQQVYLFDLDLRRPALADRFGIEIECGLETFFDGKTNDLGSIGRKIEGTGLGVFATNRIDPYPGDMLGGERLDAFIAALHRLPSNCVVLCDLPPAFVSDDALSVIGRLDAYIHVLDEGVTPKRQAEELRNMMQPAPCLGVVLNRYDGQWNDSYGYASSRQYDRYHDAED